MFDLDPAKLLMLGFLALVVLGPNRLPQAARTVGRMIGQLRAMSTSFQTEVKDALGEPGEAITSALGEFRTSDIRRSVRQTVTSAFTVPPASPNGSAGQAEPTIATGNGSGGGAGLDPSPPVQSGTGAPLSPDDPSLN